MRFRSILSFTAFRMLFLLFAMLLQATVLGEGPIRISLWPGVPPGDAGKQFPPEVDDAIAKPSPVAGQPIQRIANVSQPELIVYPAADRQTPGPAVVICPGGAYQILALDLEGTEVAKWLQSLGITAIVLKYRVPARDPNRRWEAALQDAQRAMRLVRFRAQEWMIDPQRVGILGFSAGGDAAARTMLTLEAQYESIDATDQLPMTPNLGILVYPAYLVEGDPLQLRKDLEVTPQSPPAFLVHALDDPVVMESSLQLFSAYRKVKVPAELHIFDRGGHGYGLRPTEAPVTRWSQACERWMERQGWVASKPD
jgi:acetyl esterase/lipase